MAVLHVCQRFGRRCLLVLGVSSGRLELVGVDRSVVLAAFDCKAPRFFRQTSLLEPLGGGGFALVGDDARRAVSALGVVFRLVDSGGVFGDLSGDVCRSDEAPHASLEMAIDDRGAGGVDGFGAIPRAFFDRAVGGFVRTYSDGLAVDFADRRF